MAFEEQHALVVQHFAPAQLSEISGGGEMMAREKRNGDDSSSGMDVLMIMMMVGKIMN